MCLVLLLGLFLVLLELLNHPTQTILLQHLLLVENRVVLLRYLQVFFLNLLLQSVDFRFLAIQLLLLLLDDFILCNLFIQGLYGGSVIVHFYMLLSQFADSIKGCFFYHHTFWPFLLRDFARNAALLFLGW